MTVRNFQTGDLVFLESHQKAYEIVFITPDAVVYKTQNDSTTFYMPMKDFLTKKAYYVGYVRYSWWFWKRWIFAERPK